MALVNSLFGEISGKLGGNVFFRNKGGTCIRVWAKPTNPNSARQQAARNWLSWCASTWESTLTEAQREMWRVWATNNTTTNRLGQTINLTGFDWYCMVNSRLLDCAATPIDEPADLSVPDSLLTAVLTIASATTVSIAFTAALESGERIVAWGSGPIGPGTDPNFRQARLIGYSPADQATPAVLTLPYTMEEDKKLKVWIGKMSPQGRISTFLVDDDIYSP